MTVADAPTVVQPDVDTEDSLKELEEPYVDDDNPNLRTHIVRPYENGHIYMPGDTAKEIVARARFLQVEVVALCGHRWVPQHNPKNYDSCDPCFKIAAEIDADPHSHD